MGNLAKDMTENSSRGLVDKDRRPDKSGRSKKTVIGSLLAPLLLTACGSLGALQATSQPNPVSSSPQSVPLTSSSPTSSSQWKLTWEDDFSGSGSPTNWKYDVGGYGFGDKQLQWNGTTNAQQTGDDGLVIAANRGGGAEECWYGACQYTSAKIQTTFAQEYGRFEARIKLPTGKGLWPAFWMIPASTETGSDKPGEIDVIEVNDLNPYLVTGYVHDAQVYNHRVEKVLDIPASTGFHTYGVDWSPSGITWTFDGQPYGHIKAYPNWPFDQPFIMILDLAVGGSWPGPPDANTAFPAQMDVSWVRVYKPAN
jgi:beta-glucanase (GH16 family)